jgi:hypothetical protein
MPPPALALDRRPRRVTAWPAPAGARTRLEWGKRVRLLPAVLILGYLSFTVLVFRFGPWWFPPVNNFTLYLFLACAHGALLAGYVSAAHGRARGFGWRLTPGRLIAVAVAANLAVLLPTAAFRTGSLLPNILAGIENPGQAYNLSFALRRDSAPLVEYVRIAFGPFLAMLLPLTLAYWKQIGMTLRVAAVASTAGLLAIFVSMGTNKAIADALLVSPAVLAAGYYGGRLQLTWRQKAAGFGALVVCGGLFFWFFSEGMRGRSGSTAAHGYIPGVRARANYEHWALRGLPVTARIGVLGMSNYLSNGYYGLALALEQPFVPMYGVGHSRFLNRQAARLLKDEGLLYESYPERVQAATGWDAYVMWATIHPWIASDVGFPGAVLVVFLIGRYFAQAWLDSLRGANPFAIAMLGQFVIMLFYFCANNQCLQDGEGVTAFWAIFLLWRRSRAVQAG